MTSTLLTATFCVVAAASLLHGQESAPVSTSAGKTTEKIAWFGTWTEGVAAASRAGKPILLISGAPHCHGISGIW